MSLRKLQTTNHLISNVREYASTWIEEKVPSIYAYHNLAHTIGVVEAAIKIATKSKLSSEKIQDLTIAAWFHDTAYDQGPENHEEKGAEYAASFLKNYNYPAQRILNIRQLILATKPSNTPQNLDQQIIRDADLAHLGNEYYWESCVRLREEMRAVRKIVMTDQEWIDFELGFLNSHQYYSASAKKLYKNQKEIHILKLQGQKE